MGRKILVLVIAAGMFTTVRAEILLPDSVELFLHRSPKDSSYITRLNKMAFDFLKSNPEISRSLAEKSIQFSRAIKFTRGIARALNVTGSSYWVTGNYESALNFYHLAARESEKVRDKIGLAESYHNMGEVYKKLGDYAKAIDFLQTSMDWDAVNKVNYSITLYNIGEAYYFLGDFDSASTYFDRSLSKALKESDPRTIAYAYTGLGRIKHHYRDYFTALAWFTKAERLWKEQHEIRALIQTYQDFSETFLALGQHSRALEYVNMAIVLSDEIDAPDLHIYNYRQQSKLYANQGDLKKALAALELHGDMKDSVYHQERSEEIARLQASFESGARDIENQQLKAMHALQDARIRTQKIMLIAITAALIASAVMGLVLFRQRKRVAEVNDLLREKTMEIQIQKEEIESQTAELQDLNNQLQDLNKSLESKIEERTRRLTWQKQKLAEYAHANAHQLRAPVVSILGLLHLIERIELPENDRILVQKLQVCGMDLDSITRVIARNLEEDQLR
ncbi:MAG TPA: tetratricopeptide repeat protein [Cyclobacteriaceae bacterium]|nr:tetratricopeptide repeat protein [Cyclobacteriaceae bacterium]